MRPTQRRPWLLWPATLSRARALQAFTAVPCLARGVLRALHGRGLLVAEELLDAGVHLGHEALPGDGVLQAELGDSRLDGEEYFRIRQPENGSDALDPAFQRGRRLLVLLWLLRLLGLRLLPCRLRRLSQLSLPFLSLALRAGKERLA